MGINNNFKLADELERQNKNYLKKDNFLGVDILTLANKVDAVRGTMLSNMLQQAVCIKNAQPPRVFTRYENQVGKYSSSYFKTKTKYKIIAKVKKFKDSDNYYTLIVRDMKTGVYDVIERKIGEKLTESYCYLNKNMTIDKYKKNDIIPKGEVLFHSTNFDGNMNYSYGINVPVCYMIDNDTIEDAVVVSKSLSERMVSNYMHEIPVSVNSNDILLNLYGTDREYKCFPEIGERTRGKVLLARRRVNYENALYDLSDEQLKNINYTSDKVFYVNSEGTIVDIDIYMNDDIETLKKYKYNSQLVKYLENQTNYYKILKNFLEPLVTDPNKKCTHDLTYLYRRACDVLNTDIPWKNDKTDFDNMIIVFRILEDVKLHIGSKIAGRYGDKGVVSKILPDEQMPISEDGIRAHAILNPLGVPNRLNPAQLYEVELNFISDNIVKDMKKMKLKDAKNFYFEYLKDVNKQQYLSVKEFYMSLDSKERAEYIKDVMREGIYIHQPPFWDNIGFDKISMLYDKYGYKPYKTFIEGEETENSIIIADKYMLRLKHEPSGKHSSRSTSYINMKNSPSKSLNYKKHEEPYSKTPIRIGEMELVNLLLTKNSKIQAKFNSFYSNNENNRKLLSKVLLTAKDVLNIEKIDSVDTNNGSKTLLNVLFKTLSLKLKPIKVIYKIKGQGDKETTSKKKTSSKSKTSKKVS